MLLFSYYRDFMSFLIVVIFKVFLRNTKTQLSYLYTLDSFCSFLLPISNSDVTRSSSKSISL